MYDKAEQYHQPTQDLLKEIRKFNIFYWPFFAEKHLVFLTYKSQRQQVFWFPRKVEEDVLDSNQNQRVSTNFWTY